MIEEAVVGDELFFHQGLLEDGVAAVVDFEVTGVVENGAGVLVELGGLGQA